MKFLLTSQSIYNETIAQALRDLLDKPISEARVVYIPTSYHAAIHVDSTWLVENMVSVQRLGWKYFQVIDLVAMHNYDREYWWPSVEAADVLFVGGGANYYLGYWMERSGLATALPELLKTKVYVGSSAGSAYVTKSVRFSSQGLRQLSEGLPIDTTVLGPIGQSSDRALGLVDIEFRPHYKSEDRDFVDDALLEKAAQLCDVPLYAIDDNTTLKIIDGNIEVVSEGNWKLFQPGVKA